MKVIQFDAYGGYERLSLEERPVPTPGEGQVLVRMRSAGVTPLDHTARSGALPYRLKLPLVPGGSGIGEIADPGATALKAGTRVLVGGQGLGVLQDGTWREYLALPANQLLPIPADLPDDQVMALTTGAGYLTAYLALTELAGLQPGQTVLAPGIGGAVGEGTVEVARALGAGRAISTASHGDKAEQGRALGHEVIDLSQESLQAGVLRLTEGRGVDVVIDGVSGPLTGQELGALAPGGQLVVVGYAGGKEALINVTDIIWRKARIHGFMFSLFAPEKIVQAHLQLFEWLRDGRLKPSLGRRFPLEQAAAATRCLIEERPYGRVVLDFD